MSFKKWPLRFKCPLPPRSLLLSHGWRDRSTGNSNAPFLNFVDHETRAKRHIWLLLYQNIYSFSTGMQTYLHNDGGNLTTTPTWVSSFSADWHSATKLHGLAEFWCSIWSIKTCTYSYLGAVVKSDLWYGPCIKMMTHCASSSARWPPNTGKNILLTSVWQHLLSLILYWSMDMVERFPAGLNGRFVTFMPFYPVSQILWYKKFKADWPRWNGNGRHIKSSTSSKKGNLH